MQANLKSKFSETQIILDIKEKQYPNTTDAEDAQWYIVDLKVVSQFFSANIINVPYIRYNEIISFIKEIQKILTQKEGIAELKLLEPFLYIKIKLNTFGQAEVEAVIRDINSRKQNQLDIFFESDQTILNEFVRELSKIRT